MFVSHFILEELSKLVGDPHRLRSDLAKYRKRYPEDEEFDRLCELFENYVESYDPVALKAFNEHLKSILVGRKRESGGGGSLPLSDRRRMRDPRTKR